MRKRRSGCIVNISSVGGIVAHPGSGFYAATKFAVEALSEALSKETKPLGPNMPLAPHRRGDFEIPRGPAGVKGPIKGTGNGCFGLN
jgi:hypothetical protein